MGKGLERLSPGAKKKRKKNCSPGMYPAVLQVIHAIDQMTFLVIRYCYQMVGASTYLGSEGRHMGNRQATIRREGREGQKSNIGTCQNTYIHEDDELPCREHQRW